MEKRGIKMGPIATPLRVLVCNVDKTPQIDKTLELFGKDEVSPVSKAVSPWQLNPLI